MGDFRQQKYWFQLTLQTALQAGQKPIRVIAIWLLPETFFHRELSENAFPTKVISTLQDIGTKHKFKPCFILELHYRIIAISKTYINQAHANSHAATIFILSLGVVPHSIDQLAGIISSQLRTSRAYLHPLSNPQSALKCELRLRQELELQFIGICYHSPCHVAPHAELRMLQRKNLIQLGPLNYSPCNGKRRCIHTKDIQVCFSIENN